MDNEEAVEPQNEMDEILEQPMVEQEEIHEEPQDRESVTQVPLSALQKERKKRQELELELQWERKRMQQAPQPEPEEDTSSYESATKADLRSAQDEAIKVIEERMWIKSNPEKYEEINEFLPQFLKQRPHLARAINDSPNRYEEAYLLMTALTPRQQAQVKQQVPKRVAPNSPSGVPKAASLNASVDVMNMSDQDFSKWRQEQRKRR
jgi:uncharacterized protein (DUF1778 family)